MALVSDLTKAEENLLEKMTEGNSLIQLLAGDGENSYVCVGNRRVDPAFFLLCHINPNRKVCNGNIGNKKVALSYVNELNVQSDELRIIVDRRNSEEMRLYGYNKEAAFILKEEEEVNDKNLVIAYIENQSFAQLIVFNSKLNRKTSEIIVKKESMFKELRNNAFTIVGAFFPAIHDFIIDNEDLGSY
ncbi:hypothetical protein RGU11_00745 [Rossellomorea marisflavi]|uniref:hypothetical protein n=1 Tax=Rossellomorea marisflavi TaxID=189381 RepID=UPI002852F54F|nr:hypothetical protein [Rossellomorea marisflavi]MDR4934900.1 hypothetical protein [Rossellomorea marisflavi]